MSSVTVSLPGPYGERAHEGATEFASVHVPDEGACLEVYKDEQTVAVYAPGKWASAVLT